MRSFPLLSALVVATLLAACADESPGGATPGGSSSGSAPLIAAPAWTIGTSVGGRPIVVERYGDTGPRVLLMAAIHGNERPAVVFGERMRSLLLSGIAEERGVQVVLLQAANPDGIAASTRANSHGIDLNRNFPSANFAPSADHGQAPLQEPESAAVAALVESLDPAVIVTVHNPLDQMDWNGPADDLAQKMAKDSGIPLLPPLGGLPGSLGSWAGDDMGIPIITMELPSSVGTIGGYDAGLVAVRTALAWAAAGSAAGAPWEPEDPVAPSWVSELLVTSAGGRVVRIDRVGEGPRTVLVVGGMDGSDRTTFVAERLRSGALIDGLPARLVLVTQPNPDGLLSGTGHNADGQPVEAGFPADSTPEAPEAAALVGLLEAVRPDVVVVVEPGAPMAAALIGADATLRAAVSDGGMAIVETPAGSGSFAERAGSVAPVVRLLVPESVGSEGQALPYGNVLRQVAAIPGA